MNNLLIGASALLLVVTSSLKTQEIEAAPEKNVSTAVDDSVADASGTPSAPSDCSQDLGDTVFIIDPGHGGTDPGTQTKAWGQDVSEAPYALDISLRMKRYVECNGGTAVMTRVGSEIFDLPANQIIPFDRKADIFTSNGEPVVSGREGMNSRLEVIETTRSENPGKKIVWMSVHIDRADSKSKITGVHILVPRSNSESQMTKSILAEIKKEKRSRSYTKKGSLVEAALFINEDERNVYVLKKGKNDIALRYLIEVGNFAEAKDSYRIRNPFVRENLARLLIDGAKTT